MATHPSRQELAGLVFGTLNPDRCDHVSNHVENCGECEAAIRQLETSSDEVVHLLRQQVPVDAFEQEAECGEFVSLINSIVGSPSPTGVDDLAGDWGNLRDYRLVAKIGEGGMGAVYRAIHTRLDKTVAIKVLPPERMQDAAAVARFEREMRAAGRFEHPNIVRAHDAGEVEGRHFLVMEYVDGIDLSRLCARSEDLRIADACELVRQAAVGLQCAHEHGLVHRDIKPSNLMLAPGESGSTTSLVKVLDLGLALLEDPTVGLPRELTKTGQAMGTLDYMAPEQIDDSHEVDIRADIYSLGATLYKLLVGHAPFDRPEHEGPLAKLKAMATQPVAPLSELRSDVPVELSQLASRMLQTEPADRPQTPAEVAEALSDLAADHDLSSLLAGMAPAPSIKSASTESLRSEVEETDDSAQLDGRSQSINSPLPPTEVFTQLAGQVDANVSHHRAGDKFRKSWSRLSIPLAAMVGCALLGILYYVQLGPAHVIVENRRSSGCCDSESQ